MKKTFNIWWSQGFADKILSAILIATVLGAIVALAYSIAVPEHWE
ncbi:hypothetical protein ACFLWG_01130 [Chloroflexota bacterium]